jgi:serine/threonine protein kinase
MAPEQAEGRTREIGPATDVHALGAMLYEMLTGRPPFLAETVQETLAQVRFQEAMPPSQLEPKVSRELERICLKCLRKDAGLRYASAAALVGDLQRFLAGEQTRTDEFQLIPGYEVLEEIGRGGMGVVHKARQVNLDRLVALKIFRDRLERFLAANRALARLHHPNIVEVYDCGEREGLLYVAEELVDGGSLEQRIAGQPQPAREAAQLVETLARAIHYVHQHGIVHRNLKPPVVLLTALGIPKVSSFDLARLLPQEPDDAESRGSIVGTPTYMAPEQAAGKVAEVGPATDVYALGAILYELLTGQPPFTGKELLELLSQVRAQEPAPPSRLCPEIPRDLDAICLRCLRKEPADRYASAEALAQDLRYCVEGRPLQPPPPGLIERVRKWIRGRTEKTRDLRNTKDPK